VSAKFCQNCKKTYTEPGATFCEECGADLVPLEAEDAISAEGLEEFDEAQPFWKKHLRTGTIAAVALALVIVLPGVIKDEVGTNVRVRLDESRLLDTLSQQPPKIALSVTNSSWFSIHLNSVDFKARVLGVEVASTCQEADAIEKDIPNGGKTTQVDIPLCISFNSMQTSLENLRGDFGRSGLSLTVVAKIFGMTVRETLPPDSKLDEGVVRTAFKLRSEDDAASDPDHDRKPKPTKPERHFVADACASGKKDYEGHCCATDRTLLTSKGDKCRDGLADTAAKGPSSFEKAEKTYEDLRKKLPDTLPEIKLPDPVRN
jgi:hypothetical protein